eukprot:TRINITY_DN10329_c0_g1_i1.p1 TRINITY_DN10329_c0_g1~~TRINITY_DN10329_c0_g1_i1.p1  ORF type:complete len:210 (+),score=41.90 TRINITY_DN10329_c0_g1_i1:154-783(+)
MGTARLMLLGTGIFGTIFSFVFIALCLSSTSNGWFFSNALRIDLGLLKLSYDPDNTNRAIQLQLSTLDLVSGLLGKISFGFVLTAALWSFFSLFSSAFLFWSFLKKKEKTRGVELMVRVCCSFSAASGLFQYIGWFTSEYMAHKLIYQLTVSFPRRGSANKMLMVSAVLSSLSCICFVAATQQKAVKRFEEYHQFQDQHDEEEQVDLSS